jgi:arsenite-transporting ATPase
VLSSAPGIDEVMVFTSVIKSIEDKGFDLVIFDTAPTGHTLKLLNFPTTTEAALTKLLGMKDKLKGMMQMFGGQAEFENMFNKAFARMEEVRTQSEKFKKILTNPVRVIF